MIKRYRFLLTVALLFATVCTVPAPAQNMPPDSGSAVVWGYVFDTAPVPRPIPGVTIQLFQATNISPTGCFSYIGRTDLNGRYVITGVKAGIYKAHATTPDPRYESQWYNGKSSARDADSINVASGSATRVDFSLRLYIPPRFDVRGTVTDTLSVPLRGAKVWFVHAAFALNANTNLDDFRGFFEQNAATTDCRMEGISPYVIPAVTDSQGNYLARVPPGVYIVFSRKPGYMIQFFDHKPDFFTANRVKVERDTSGIDFSLIPLPPPPYGSISGQVMDRYTHTGVRSRIIAFRNMWLPPLGNLLWPPIRVYTTDTDSLGNYMIDEMVPGRYFVLALPLGRYAPAFYTNDTTGIHWRFATPVLINGYDVTGIDIYVRPLRNSLAGFTWISGRVTSGSSQPRPGAFVYAMRNGEIAGFDFAGPDGKYTINGLAPGSYTVEVDQPGYDHSTPITATPTYDNFGKPTPATNVDFSILTDVTTPDGVLPEEFGLAQNYPNPFNPSTTIAYTLRASGPVTLKVFNLLGQEIATLVNGPQTAGTHTVTFAAHGFASGVYFYRLQSQGNVVTRRMVLLQ